MALKIVSAYLLAVLGGKEKPSKADVEKILKAMDLEYDADMVAKLCSELEGKDLAEIIAAGKEKLKGFGGGGGGGGGGGAAAGGDAAAGGGAAAAAAAAPEEEEEDMEFDLFD